MTDTFLALPIRLDDKSNSVVCTYHSLAACDICKLDFQPLNSLHHKFNHLSGDQQYPPPPSRPPLQVRSIQISKMKDSGNSSFKMHKYTEALKYYTLAIDMAVSRPPWEPAALCRDETVILLCNRSAAHLALQEYPEALADAEAVVRLKKPWTKGHFRKCRVCKQWEDWRRRRILLNWVCNTIQMTTSALWL
jgi:translocation protein SEC72